MDGAQIGTGQTEVVAATLMRLAPDTAGQPATLDRLGERVREYLDAARSASSHRAYRADWQHFADWCAEHDLVSLPAVPDTLVLYLTTHAEALKPSTLKRRLVSIAQAHRAAGLATPTEDASVRSLWRGIRRTIGTAQVGKSARLTDDITAMVTALPDTSKGVRDRALPLLGFAGALRRSELVALDVADVELVRDGAIVTIRRSKTDQEGEGRKGRHPSGQARRHVPRAGAHGVAGADRRSWGDLPRRRSPRPRRGHQAIGP